MSSTIDRDEMGFSSKEELVQLLQRHEPLYAMLDAARDPAVLKLVNDSKERSRSLYDGRRGEQLAEVAPYLVRLSAGSTLFERLVWKGWGQSWGVFIACAAPFDDLRRHLRRFLVVQTEDRQALYFRFYDPRVLAPFLDTATNEERSALFGPVSAFLMEGRCEGTVLQWLSAEAPTLQPDAPWELLTIRDTQVNSFSQSLLERFIDRMEMTPQLPAWVRGNRTMIREEVDRARRYGIGSERGLERYLMITSVLEPGFDLRVPWARRELRREGADERRKLRRLEHHLQRAGSRAMLAAGSAQPKDSQHKLR
ncbi:DUF4123 domain-containing protein [Sorangium sp. So ce385]|uniref:DUF4123 domain-containing protein n=1 Tax=Sorangium sp. So ce385 TaxID=3133308 RepID=UPI003F5B48CA